MYKHRLFLCLLQTPNRPLTADFFLQPLQSLKNHFSLDLPSTSIPTKQREDPWRTRTARLYRGAGRRAKEAVRGATRGSPNSLAYSGTFQKLLVLLR
ncbi:hypothetical protein E1A91_A12G192000v1 [Gossypium mustelinum]|uniref:Uncharacterized protein n=1 Tax=Gossypium mustelinum TaxID=34275 RepID=A0A5D2WWB3_GOSMU|nr:hypothetical protein E1A91_A12G192000v1 [Gossypium mustelinum]